LAGFVGDLGIERGSSDSWIAMIKIRSLLSVGYSLVQITLGLLLHPYQTMQMLVEDKVFVWMALLPSGVLGLVTVVWRYGVVPVVRLVFSCQQSGLAVCEAMPFFSNWITFFMIYWQVLLMYLLFRFEQVWSQR
jgi:hypothetical protein